MKPKHSCGKELEILRYYYWDIKRKRTMSDKPITESGAELMWCKKCKTAVAVEVRSA